MIDRAKVIGLLHEMAEYFRECRSNASFASKAENHFWELQNAANEAVELLKEQEPKLVLSERKSETMPFRYERKGFCPICHQVVSWTLNRSFCGFCGQELKWND